MKIFQELSRRNVFRVAIAYAVASWVILQVVDVVAPIFDIPEWVPKFVFIMLAAGFIPLLLFSWAYELTPDGLKRDSEVSPDQSVAHATGRKLTYVTIALLVGAIALQFASPSSPDVTAPGEQAVTLEEGHTSIAVLPFVNMSSDPEQEYFSDGITEEILNSLASVRELKVAGRTSSFAFKGENQDLRHIGEALGVEHILEGSVRKAGDSVRVTAQLIKANDGFHIWSETYDHELTDVFRIQDEIAHAILQQLQARLLQEGKTLDDNAQVAEARSTAPEVYDLYLRAKQRIYTRHRENIEAAIEELDEAIALDPDYAPAYAQRGIAVMLLSDQQYGDIPQDEATRRAKRFIDRALEIDDTVAEAWAGLGLYYGNTPGEYHLAIEPLLKALEINPNLIDASNWLHISLQDTGDFRGAADILADLTERDPLYRPAFSNAIVVFNTFGERDKVDKLISRMQIYDPDSPDLVHARAVNLMYSGKMGEGVLLYERLIDMVAPDSIGGVPLVYLSVGLSQTMQFERVINEGSPFYAADALYESGRKDEAFEQAYAMARSGYPFTLFYLLVRDHRYQDLTDYLEERWPSIDAFAEEYRGDSFGYGEMLNLALAYRAVGNPERADAAMGHLQRHIASLQQQGMNHVGLDFAVAEMYALLGDKERALEALASAVDKGASSNAPLAVSSPALQSLTDDPRFEEIERRMLDNLNHNREVLGLPPVDENYVVQVEL